MYFVQCFNVNIQRCQKFSSRCNGHTSSTESESSTNSEKCEDFVLNEVGSDSSYDDVPLSSLVLNSKNEESDSESDLPLSVLRIN